MGFTHTMCCRRDDEQDLLRLVGKAPYNTNLLQI